MPDFEKNTQEDFLRETIKAKPVNKRKLVRRTIITASMAVVFGLIACVTFLVLEPVISNWLYPEEKPYTVVFPEDKEEMSPEEMLAEKEPEETPSPTPQISIDMTTSPLPSPVPGKVELDEEQIAEILNDVTLDLNNYKELYGSMSEYVQRISKCMVTVTAVTYNVDWFNDVQARKNQCSGVIISENGTELLILTDYTYVRTAEQLLLTFHDGSEAEATVKQFDKSTNLAVLSVALESLSEEIRADELPIAVLGASNGKNMAGTPVVAIGSPMGVSNSVGYGILTTNGTLLSMVDRNYKIFLTDIHGSKAGSGVLFNLQSQVIGIITNQYQVSDVDDMLTAYGTTELKKIIEKMSNESKVAYLGISGIDVTKEVNTAMSVPLGAYVTEIALDSPAMRAGVQRGDVIVEMNEATITSFSNYSNALLQMEPGQMVNITIMRLVQDEYKELVLEIELGEARN